MKRDGVKRELFEAVMRQRLKSDRAGATADGADCPEPSVIAAYAEHSIDATERQRWEHHFSTCARCQSELAALARIDSAAAGRSDHVHVPFWRRFGPVPLAGAAILAACALAIVLIASNRLRVDQSKPTEVASARDYAAGPLDKLQSAETNGDASASARRETMEGAADSKQRSRAARQAPARSRAPAASSSAVPEAAMPANAPQVAAGKANANSAFAERSLVPDRNRASASASGALAGAESGALLGGAAGRAASGDADALPTAPGASATIVSAPDRTVVWMLGAHGAISRYSANGVWQPQQSGARADLTAGSAPSASVCWVVGKSGTVVRTIDGQHWARVASPTTADLISVNATNADAATVMATDRRGYVTSDGGQSWHPVDAPTKK